MQEAIGLSTLIGLFGLIGTIFFNVINTNRNREKDIIDKQKVWEERSRELGEQSTLLQSIMKNVEKIAHDNAVNNERFYQLSERMSIVENRQQTLIELTKQIYSIDQKLEQINSRISIIEHDRE